MLDSFATMESARATYISMVLVGFTVFVYRWLHNKKLKALNPAHYRHQHGHPRKSLQPRGKVTQHDLPDLNQLNPDKTLQETDVDIIAIHGLDTKSPDTWKWKSSNKREPENRNNLPLEVDVNWLADTRMLPTVAGRARIYTLDWPAKLFNRSPTPTTLEESAQCLLRVITQHIKANSSRPIVFIASCFGGIILLKALDIDHQDGDNGMDSPPSLRQTVRGIVFLATPFRGTAFRMIPGYLLKVLVSLRDRTMTALINYSLSPTSDLDALVKRFITLKIDCDYNVAMFWEAENTVLLRKFYLAWMASRWMFLAWVVAFPSTIFLGLFSPWLVVFFVLWWFVIYRHFKPQQVRS